MPVQHGVIELVVDDGRRQQALDAATDDWPSKDAVHARPPLGLGVQQLRHQRPQFGTEVRVYKHARGVRECEFYTHHRQHLSKANASGGGVERTCSWAEWGRSCP